MTMTVFTFETIREYDNQLGTLRSLLDRLEAKAHEALRPLPTIAQCIFGDEEELEKTDWSYLTSVQNRYELRMASLRAEIEKLEAEKEQLEHRLGAEVTEDLMDEIKEELKKLKAKRKRGA